MNDAVGADQSAPAPPQSTSGKRESSRAKTPLDCGIAVTGRTRDLLEALRRAQPATGAHLAAATGSTSTAAFRLLRTLAARGLTVQAGGRGKWRLSGWLATRQNAAATQKKRGTCQKSEPVD